MSINTKVTPSNEAIAYQKKSNLFMGLTSIFEQFLALPSRDQTISKLNALGFEKLIFKETGLWIQTTLVEDTNAWIFPQVLNKSNPLAAHWVSWGLADMLDDGIKGVGRCIKAREDLEAMIDLSKSRVSGLFSKIRLDVGLGKGLWREAKLKPDEVAAIMIHELGHGFTFFEAAIWGTVSNITLATAKQELSKHEDPVIRLRIITDSCRAMGIRDPDVKKLVELSESNPEGFDTLMMTTSARDMLYATKTRHYNNRASEVVADQFAVRHGAGAALAGGLAGIMDFGYSPGIGGSMAHWIVQILEFTVMVVGTVGIALILMLLGLFFTQEDNEVYDTPVKRIKRMEMDLIQIIKDRALSSEEQREIQQTILKLRQITTQYKDRRSMYDMVGMLLTKFRRGQVNAKKFEEELERFVTTDLFVHASTLKTLR